MAENTVEYLDVSLLDPKRVRHYYNWIPHIQTDEEKKESEMVDGLTFGSEERIEIMGMISKDNENVYHKYCGFNKYTVETFPIPSSEDGWETNYDDAVEDAIRDWEDMDKYNDNRYCSCDKSKENYRNTENHHNERQKYIDKRSRRALKYVIKCQCDPSAKIYIPSNEDVIPNIESYKIYQTHDNGGWGYVVYIDEKRNVVHVYGYTKDVVQATYEYDFDDISKRRRAYNNLIKTYNPIEIFIGKSTLNEMTEYSGGHGSVFDGNTILLRIGNMDEYRYVCIGEGIFEFTTSEKITNYVSSVGNNDVPYPYAESENYTYCMMNYTVAPIQCSSNRHKWGTVFESYDEGTTTTKLDNFTCIERRGSDDHRFERTPPSDDSYNVIRITKPGAKFVLAPNTCNVFKSNNPE